MDYSNPVIDRSKYHWDWDNLVLQGLLEASGDIFLCGSADNQLEFHREFDKVFILTLSPTVQRHRLLTRTAHDYGKHPAMQDQIIAEQQEFVRQATALGGTPIDATPDLPIVVDTILRSLGHAS